MCWRRLSENAASVEVAAETRLPHQTVRTQIKSCKSDPFFDIDREYWAERRVEHDKLFPDDAYPKKQMSFCRLLAGRETQFFDIDATHKFD